MHTHTHTYVPTYMYIVCIKIVCGIIMCMHVGVLLQALAPSIKRDFPSEETDPMQYFTARIYRNLRIVFCLPPTSVLFSHQAQ